MIQLFYKLQLPVLFLIFIFSIWFCRPAYDNEKIFGTDGLRYVSYAVSIYKHNVFGLADRKTEIKPAPSNANAPLYPALIAGVMMLNQDFADSLICTFENGLKADCPQNFDIFFYLQIFLSALSLYFVYILAFKISNQRIIGWLATFLALASGIFQEYSFVVLTELLVLPVFAALLIFCLQQYRHPSLKWIIVIGIMLGILTLIRPSYLYLFYGFTLFFTGLWICKRSRKTGLTFVILILSFAVTVSPWSVRNKLQFGSYGLTTGGYAEAILIERTNYNQMRWQEIPVAMIYWLPDFGDSLARTLFSDDLHNKLGWGDDTYYAQGYLKKYQALSEELGGEDKILGYLIREELFSVKHFAVSVALALRGSFVAKYWGLTGFIAFLCLLIQTVKCRKYEILIISLPLFYMVAFHAGLSVSISRYNSPLIILYSLSIASYIHFYGQKIVTKVRSK